LFIFSFRNLIRELLLVLIAFIVVAGVLELILRMNQDFGLYDPPALPRRDPKGAHVFYGKPWSPIEAKQVFRLNASGYPAPEFSAEPGKALRVAVLGDSFVQALHVPSGKNFMRLAEQSFSDAQVLSIGESGRFFPQQLPFMRQEEPRLFGKEGIYPPVNAYIFCVRSRPFHEIASGDPRYHVPGVMAPWRFRAMALLTAPLTDYFTESIRSRVHIKSLLAQRMTVFLSDDLNRQLTPFTDKGFDHALRLLFDQTVIPLVKETDLRKARIAFLFLPDPAEVSAERSGGADSVRHAIIQGFRDRGLSIIDATGYIPEGMWIFFKYDLHYNENGHKMVAIALHDLIRGLYPEISRKEEARERP
jgi:hypothetical protein